jgi:hypothetical protein
LQGPERRVMTLRKTDRYAAGRLTEEIFAESRND